MSSSREQRLADGKYFKTARQAKKYVFKSYLQMKDMAGQTRVFHPNGAVASNPVELNSLKGCRVYILDASEQVIIENCEQCEIVVAACCSTVFVRKTKQTKLFVACKQMYMADTSDVLVKHFCMIGPSIERCTNITFGVFNVRFPSAFEAWTRAGLLPHKHKCIKNYRKVQDADSESGSTKNNFSIERFERSDVLDLGELLSGVVPQDKYGPASNPLLENMPIGQMIEARYRRKKYWFRGKISGTPCRYGSRFHVDYADGDKEKDVDSKYVRVYAPKLKFEWESPQVCMSWISSGNVENTWKQLSECDAIQDGMKTIHEDVTKGTFSEVVLEDSSASSSSSSSKKNARHVAMIKLTPITSTGGTFVEWVSDFFRFEHKEIDEKVVWVKKKIRDISKEM